MTDLDSLAKRLTAISKRRLGMAVALCGAAGIGKSFAAARLLGGLHFRAVSVRAVTTRTQLIQALGKPKHLPAWVERELEQNRAPSLAALLTLLKHLAPLALHVEDLHECDAAQLEFWTDLAGGVRQLTGVALIASSRTVPATVPPAVFEIVTLEPLSASATRGLLEREIGATLPHAATAWIQARAAGNPLFSLEFLRFLARRGLLWSDGSQWHWRDPERDLIPATVEAMIERAISEACATPAERAALEARAYCELRCPNQPLEAALWAEVAGLPIEELRSSASLLRSKGVLNETGFNHPLFREVPISTLTAAAKCQLSKRALTWLEDQHPARAAAFLSDADCPSEQAFALLERARVAFEQQGDHALARDCLVRSVTYAPPQQRADLALRAARQLLDAGDARVSALLEPIIAQMSDPSAALLLLAGGQALQGEREAVKATLHRVVQTQSDLEWLTVRIRLYFTAGLHEELLALWRESSILHAQVSTVTLYYVAWSLLDHGDFAAALALTEPRLAAAQTISVEHAELLDIRASVAFYEGRYAQAVELFDQIAALYRHASGAWDGLSNALRNGCVTKLQLGQYRSSLAGFEEALRLYGAHGKWTLYAQTLQMTATATLELGDFERTQSHLLEALEILATQPQQPFLVHVLSSLTALYLDWPAPHALTLAHKYALWGQRVAEQLPNPMLQVISQLSLARLALGEGRGRVALELACDALSKANELGAVELQLNAQLLLGLAFEATNQFTKALEQLRVALHNALTHEMPLEAHKISLEIARVEGDAVGAAQCLEWFVTHGLHNGAKIARRYFPTLERQTEVAPTLRLEGQPTLRLEVLGQIRVQVAGRPQALRGRKRQELLVQLFEARLQGRAEVSSSALCDALYAGASEPEAAGALKQVVFKLRVSYGAGVIVTTAQGYALGAIASDAEDFLRSSDTRLWRGAPTMLSDATLELLALALQTRAAALLATDLTEAVRAARILLELTPYDVHALTLLCMALHAAGNHRSLNRVYESARDQWLEVGDQLPLRWQEFLAAQTSSKETA